MATSIVDTLFGISPERLEQQRAAEADARALQFAKLDPFQQANFAIGRGAYGLAGALGGALGGQDPELQRVTRRQQVAGQIDYTNEDSIRRGMASLSDDPVAVQQLAQILRQQQESGALIEQRGAAANREAKQSVPTDIQVARELSNLETTAAALEAMEPSVERDQALRTINGQLTNLRALTSKPGEKGPSFGAEAERVAAEMFDNKTFAQLTPTQKAAVNKRVDEEGNRRAASTAAKLVLPGQNALVDIPGFRAKVQDTIRPQLQAVTAADNALITINDSMATGNFISFNAARVQLAKSLGDNQLSRRDVEQAGGDPSILGGLADTASTLFTGTPTLDTQNKIKRTLMAIKTVATKKANAEINRQRKIALRTPGYNPEAVDAALDFPEFQIAPPAAVATQYATNPQTKERIMSTDGGKTWNPVR
jgi:hypothetical protein